MTPYHIEWFGNRQDFFISDYATVELEPNHALYNAWAAAQSQVSFPLPRISGSKIPTEEDCCFSSKGIPAFHSGAKPDLLITGPQHSGVPLLSAFLQSSGDFAARACPVDSSESP